MSLYYRKLETAIVVYGNTYAVRERLKAMGGRWSGAEKNWRLPNSDENLSVIEGMCTAFGGARLGGAASGPTEGAGEAAANVDVMADGGVSSAPQRIGAAAKSEEVLGTGEPQPTGDAAAGVSIRELMEKVGFAVSQAFPRAIWVVGEVQNLARRPSGVFFELAEAADGGAAGGRSNATLTVKAILWNAAQTFITARRGPTALAEVLADGMKVRVLCQVQLYRERGQVTLVVDDLDPTFTKGALALEREKLLKELRGKGLDDKQRKLPRPAFPFLVGLISAPGSRAASDFLDQLQSLRFPGEVIFQAAPMQGEAVPARVAAAIARLEALNVDLIVLTRGGGSVADLRWFDAPEIAYAIAKASVPVIAAIGHHDDTVVAEIICHERQKTPTAAADFVVQIFSETRARIDRLAALMSQSLNRRGNELSSLQAQLSARLAQAADGALGRRQNKLREYAHRLEASAVALLASRDRLLLTRQAELGRTADRSLAARGEALANLERTLASKDPKPWLNSGWTRLGGKGGTVLKAANLAPGMKVSARLADGRLALVVESIQMNPLAPDGNAERP